MSVKERLKAFIRHIGIRQSAFEARCSLSNGYINSISVSISNDKLENISKEFPELNTVWLIMGEGDMIKKKHYYDDNADDPVLSEPAEKYIPLIPVDAMAGDAAGDHQVMEYETQKYLIPAFSDADFLIQVRGNSMWPKYNSGDLVACKKIQTDSFFQWNKVYVIDTEQGALVKRVKKSKIENHILIVSENQSYEPFDLNINKIRSLAIVIGVLRLE
jgi:phage repressor protein C with HTH and peptisase S24 domain